MAGKPAVRKGFRAEFTELSPLMLPIATGGQKGCQALLRDEEAEAGRLVRREKQGS